VIGNGIAAANMYQALKLPWVPNLLADQRLAGMLALAIGELTLFVVMGALLLRWNQLDDMFDESGLSDHQVTLADLQTRAAAPPPLPGTIDQHGQSPDRTA
jgi:putative copper resistance protein D